PLIAASLPPVNWQPRFSFGRTIGVLVLLAAWFALSNHCALAVIGHRADAGKAAGVHKCCPNKADAGGEQTPERPMGTCCKSLRVLPADAVAKLVKASDSPPMLAAAWVALAEIPAVERPAAQVRHTTGPPWAWSFAETVLQRSLLSHAPPFAT
ncbi:MAG: hypothetical protein M3463_02910, partial [Verrucomicrobiota bacterium]|nr:hypothetical protein [Verrucomicrobiota bacterium]